MNLSSFKLTNINELISVYKENPERFNRFYNAVYLLLDGIPECGSIRVMDHCEASSYDLFIKCACWIIQEETEQKELTDALLEFSDDYTIIHRCAKFVKSKSWVHFYSPR